MDRVLLSPSAPWCKLVSQAHAAVQMIASGDGHVADDWALHKPLKWEPDLVRRTAAMRTFSSHPPDSWLDRIGISFGVLDQVRHHDA